jgi:hypothetical protein
MRLWIAMLAKNLFSIWYILLIQFESCVNSECDVRMHAYCASRKFETQNDPKCPVCSGAWKVSKKRKKSPVRRIITSEKMPQAMFDDDFVVPCTPVTKQQQATSPIGPSSSQMYNERGKGKMSNRSNATPSSAPTQSDKKMKRNQVVVDDDSD